MARVAFLLPREDMLRYIPALAEKYHLDILEARAIRTSEALEATRQVIEAGADIVVARGLQAELIRTKASVPLVPIQFTAQEIGLLIEQAKTLSGKNAPTVGLVGGVGMFQDISHLGDLLRVRLVTRYYTKEEGQLLQAVEQVLQEGADVLIGGDTVCQFAAEHGLPSVFIASSPECIENACRAAQRLAYALDLEKRNTAELQTIMDYTVSCLILIDGDGAIRQLNHSAEQLLDVSQQKAEGTPVWEFLPPLTAETLAPVLQRGEELTSVHIRHKDARFLATISPFSLDGKLGGAVISIADSQQVNLYAARQRRELHHQGFSAPFTFDVLIARSPRMQTVIEQARRCARFNASVILQGELGTEKEELAQCIHNAGENAENAFVQFHCDSMEPAAVEERLFGTHGLVERAQGVLFLDEISRLSASSQYRLYRLVSGRANSTSGALTADPPALRVLAGDRRDLRMLADTGEFRKDLLYALGVTTIFLPPLRERKEDIPPLANYFLQFYQKLYGRYIHLTRTAWQWMSAYAWPGNLLELRSLCQRIVVGTPRRTVDQFFLESLLDTVAPPVEPAAAPPLPMPVGQDPGVAHIAALLAAYHGNRGAVARAMGISTTTLWRRMKKYGIQG